MHLTRLYETLDDIQAEAQAKIEAAFAEFQASYTTTLNENLIAPPLVQITGKIIQRDPGRIVIAAKGNGRRSTVLIPDDAKIKTLNGDDGAWIDLNLESYVEIMAIPQSATSSPIAQSIKIVPAPNSSGNGNGNGNDDDVITGTVIVVDIGNSGKQKVIVVNNPDGSDGAAKVTPDTIVTGDDDGLETGQVVEITLGDDGFTAETVKVVSTPDTSSTATPVPGPPIEYTIRGVIRAFSGNGVILDDVFLTLDSVMSDSDPMTVGEQIQFKVIIDENGNWSVVGIE